MIKEIESNFSSKEETKEEEELEQKPSDEIYALTDSRKGFEPLDLSERLTKPTQHSLKEPPMLKSEAPPMIYAYLGENNTLSVIIPFN